MTLFIHAKIVYNSTNDSAAPSGFKWNPACVTWDASGTHYVVTVTYISSHSDTRAPAAVSQWTSHGTSNDYKIHLFISGINL